MHRKFYFLLLTEGSAAVVVVEWDKARWLLLSFWPKEWCILMVHSKKKMHGVIIQSQQHFDKIVFGGRFVFDKQIQKVFFPSSLNLIYSLHQLGDYKLMPLHLWFGSTKVLRKFFLMYSDILTINQFNKSK